MATAANARLQRLRESAQAEVAAPSTAAPAEDEGAKKRESGHP